MRKWLGMLVAAVLMFGLVAVASAQTVEIELSTGTNPKAKFTAEVNFNVDGTFGFVLKRAAGPAAMPVVTNSSAPLVDWRTTNGGPLMAGVAPGAAGFQNSLVYAEITNNMAPGYRVLMYTDNWGARGGTSTTQYGANASSATIKPLVELPTDTATVGTDNDGLALAYMVVSSETLWTDPDIGNGSVVTGISEVHFMDADGTNENLRTRWLTDASKTVDTSTITGPSLAFAEKDNTIAVVNGLQSGNIALPKPAAEVVAGTATGEYWFVPQAEGEMFYMFFSSNFTDARRGFTYKSTEVTLEMLAGE